MLPSTIRSLWASTALLALILSVHAHPTRETNTETAAHPASNLQPRDPRLIPATEDYLADVFHMLGVPDPTPSSKPTPSTTPSSIKSQGKPENQATPMVSSTKTPTHPPSAAFTTVIRHGDNEPIESIQVGSGWKGGKKLTPEDLPFIFDAVSKVLAQRVRDVIDSSDEVGLGNDEALFDYWR